MEIENPEAEQLLYRKEWNDFIIYFLNLNLTETSSNQKVTGTGRCCFHFLYWSGFGIVGTLVAFLVIYKMCVFQLNLQTFLNQEKAFMHFASLTFIFGALVHVKTWSHTEVQKRVTRVTLISLGNLYWSKKQKMLKKNSVKIISVLFWRELTVLRKLFLEKEGCHFSPLVVCSVEKI